tara:strand:+ start:309 stop:704 length:396 start_codon:yes stop_codon:yes gene_type:complete
MGVNYYWVSDETQSDHCSECGTELREVHKSYHIGKTSAGWQFQWQAYQNSDGPDGCCHESVAHWEICFSTSDGHIEDEMGGVYTILEFGMVVGALEGDKHAHNDRIIDAYDKFNKSYVDERGYCMIEGVWS